MRVYDHLEQGSPEWHKVRKGILTASMADKILTPTGRKSSSANEIVAKMAAERMGLQEREDNFQSKWMTRGLQMEEEAINWFEFQTGLETRGTGFVLDDTELVGCSPDALIGEPLTYQGFVPLEIKCPKPSTHLLWSMTPKELPAQYKPQVHFQMSILNAAQRPYPDWEYMGAWFMSYCPPMEPLIIRVEFDDYTRKMCGAINSYIDALRDLLEKDDE